MIRLYQDCIGTPVIAEDIGGPVGIVRDLIIDSDNGKIVAVIINKRKNLVIVPQDIISWGSLMRVGSSDAIIEGSEVVRVAEVLKREIEIIGNSVFTESEKYLGKVLNALIDTRKFELTKLFTAKMFLAVFSYDRRIISAKDIIEIKRSKIIVKDDEAFVKEHEKETSAVLGMT